MPVQKNTAADYAFPKMLAKDQWALQGGWKIEEQKIVATKPGAALRLNFTAGKVFLVLGTATGRPVIADIYLNGQAIGTTATGKDIAAARVTVAANTLYELVNQQAEKPGVLEIKAQAPGLEAYAFTFGSP